MLINSVLMSIQTYWSQIIGLPRRIIREVNNICRAFLWRGKSDFMGPGSVSWEKLCIPKSAGGLGLRDLFLWNKASMIKHIWAISKKKESLWIQWVHHVYLKNEDVWEHKPPLASSWNWRRLMACKDEVDGNFRMNFQQEYSIAEGYRKLLGDFQRIRWTTQVWSRWNIPKHAFIAWLAVQNRMNTKDRIGRYIPIDQTCFFCSHFETRKHLLFDCIWARGCLEKLKQWLNWRSSKTDLVELIRWTQRSRVSKTRKKVYIAGLVALTYMIWFVRNQKLWGEEALNWECVLNQIKYRVKNRVLSIQCKKIKMIDLEWIQNL